MKHTKYKRILSRNYKKITISEDFLKHPPKYGKMQNKIDTYELFGKLDPIIVDENMVLIDGYCTYLIVDALKVPKRRFKIYKLKRNKANGQANMQKDACGN